MTACAPVWPPTPAPSTPRGRRASTPYDAGAGVVVPWSPVASQGVPATGPAVTIPNPMMVWMMTELAKYLRLDPAQVQRTYLRRMREKRAS